MTKKARSGPARILQATPKSIWDKRNSTGTRNLVNAATVMLAIWGLLPIRLASWCIRQGRKGD